MTDKANEKPVADDAHPNEKEEAHNALKELSELLGVEEAQSRYEEKRKDHLRQFNEFKERLMKKYGRKIF